MQCRSECGACCIAPSISSPLPGMPDGKLAGEHCVHLSDAFECGLWGDPLRPAVCAAFKPDVQVCGASRAEAMSLIMLLESSTQSELNA